MTDEFDPAALGAIPTEDPSSWGAIPAREVPSQVRGTALGDEIARNTGSPSNETYSFPWVTSDRRREQNSQFVNELGNIVAGGVTSGVVGAPLQALGTAHRSWANAIDREREIVRRVKAGQSREEAEAAVNASPPETTPTTEHPLYRAGEAVKKYAQETFPASQETRESLPGQIAGIAGGMAPAVLGTVTLGPVGALAGAAQFGLSSAGDTFEKAIQKGASEDDAARAAGISGEVSAAIGLLPLTIVLAPIKQTIPGLTGWAAAKLAQAAANGVTFSTVGEAQNYIESEVAKAYYDPNAQYSTDIKRIMASAIVGGGLGAHHAVQPTERLAAARDLVAAAQRELAQRQPETATPPPPEAAPELAPDAPFPTGRDKLDPNVKLMAPEVPHFGEAEASHDSVGAVRAQSALDDMLPESKKMVGDILRDNFGSVDQLDEAIENKSRHEFNSDLNEDTQRHAAGIAVHPGQPSTEIRQAYRQRRQEEKERIKNLNAEYLGPMVNQAGWYRMQTQARKNESAPFWQTFDETRITPTDKLTEILDRPDMKAATAKANRQLKNMGKPIDEGFEDELGAEKKIPTARAFQLAKEALDDKINAAFRAGKKNKARHLLTLKNDLLDAVDNHPDPAVRGVWKDAREKWTPLTRVMKAYELGRDKFLSSTLDESEVPYLLDGMGEPEKQAVLQGVWKYFDRILDRVRGGELTALRTALTDSNRAKIGALLGEQRAAEYFKALEAELRMHTSMNRLVDNSETQARKLYSKHWLPPDEDTLGSLVKTAPGIISTAYGLVRHPLRTIGKVAIQQAGKAIEGRQKGQEEHYARIRQDAARIWTMQGPEGDAALRSLYLNNGEHPAPLPERGPRGPSGGPAPAPVGPSRPSLTIETLPQQLLMNARAAGTFEAPISRFHQAEKEMLAEAGIYPETLDDGTQVYNIEPLVREADRRQDAGLIDNSIDQYNSQHIADWESKKADTDLKPPSRDDYVGQAMRNLSATSRTANAVLDLSSTKGKEEKMVAGLTPQQAAQSAKANYERLIGDLHNSMNNLPTDGRGMAAFIDDVAGRVNEGIVKPGELERTNDTKFENQTKAEDLPLAHQQFSEELAQRLADPNADPVETAAWIEWRANLMDHFWSDGVGKSSKALAAIPLMRSGLSLPTYPPNKKLFSFTRGIPRVDPRDGGQAYLGEAWDKFNAYYHDMVTPRESLQAALNGNTPLNEIVEHPLVLNAIAANEARVPTGTPENFADPAWRAARVYNFDGRQVNGWDNAVKELTAQAEAFAGGPVSRNKHAIIVLGPPAAGKSSVSEPLARQYRAAIVDPDEAKKIIPEYENGVGTSAVHEESSEMAKDVGVALMDLGTNIVVPKVGDNEASIRRWVDKLKALGYTVDIAHVAATPEISGKRNIQRFLDKGRIVDPKYIASVGDKPRSVAYIMKGEANDFLDADTSGTSPRVLDGDGRLAASLRAEVANPGRNDQNVGFGFREGAGRGPEAGRQGLIGQPPPGLQPHRVSTADGTVIDVVPVVVEADDLITSSDPGYDKSLQPRQRTARAAAQAQERDIAINLDPERLGHSSEADRGAPIVYKDRKVESGNGRVNALRMVYAEGGAKAQEYRDWLTKQGVDVSKYRKPILVRQRITPMSPEERQAFTVAANQPATLAMSATERARADAKLINDKTLRLLTNPNDIGANRDFVRRFVRELPQAEQGALMDAYGALSAEGTTRIRNALFAKAYDDVGALARVAESTDDTVRSISNALAGVAPKWAQLRADVAAGRVRPDMDVTPDLMEAVKRTAKIRGEGTKLDTYLAQSDAFNQIPDIVEGFMRAFYDPQGRRALGSKRISDALAFYADEARKASAEKGLDLGLVPVEPRDIQKIARDKGWEGYGEEISDRGGAGNGEGVQAPSGQVRGQGPREGSSGPQQAGGEGGEGPQARARQVTDRDVRGRPLRTEPFRGIGNEQAILEEGARRAVAVHPIVYHGSHESEIKTFDRNAGAAAKTGLDTASRIGSWFTTSKEDARGFGPNVHERYLDVRNPLRVEGWDGLQDIAEREGLLQKKGRQKGQISGSKMRDWLESNGYDSIHMVGGEDNVKGLDYWVALDPKSILEQPPLMQAKKRSTPGQEDLFGGPNAVSERIRGTTPQVSGGRQPGNAPTTTPVRKPEQISLFDWGGGGGDVRGPHGEGATAPIETPPTSPGASTGVTKPPLGGGRDSEGQPDKPASPRVRGRRDVEKKIEERSRSNYRITPEDGVGEGGPKQKVRANLEAIKVLKQIEDEGRQATPEEKAKLVKYSGWGHVAQQMFDRFDREGWEKERAELKSLLTPEEYETARASTPNAHYTSPDVIRGMWDSMDHLGYDGGLAIEPSAGIGHFIGLIPDKWSPKTAWTAVELDSITGRIAKALYGGAEVNVHGFEDLKRPANYYDLAISNVPFGDYSLSEKPYGTHSIHNFFFVKALDKVRPGGIVSFITSAYTMDSARYAPVRRLLAKSGDLVGAIRLPGGKEGAFADNAGTQVTTDIIYLRKKVPGDTFEGAKWDTLKEVQTPEGPTKINEYFADNPHMMLGEMRLLGSQYRANEPVLVGNPENLQQQIFEAAQKGMKAGAFLSRETPPPPEIPAIDIKGNVKDGAFFLQDGKVHRRMEGVGKPAELSEEDHDRVKRLVGLRDIYNDLLNAQLEGGDKEGLRAKLRKAYDSFVSAYGPINKEIRTETTRLDKQGNPVVLIRHPNFKAFRSDPDAFKVASIENYDSETGVAKPADIQTKDVIRPQMKRQINGPSDALAASLNDTGNVNLDHIAQSLNVDSHEAAIAALGDQIYQNPDGRAWETADKYLSGNVVKKLEEARAIAEQDPSYLRNVAALEKVQPTPLVGSEITAQFGAPWIPTEVYQDFLKSIGGSRVKVTRTPITGEYRVEAGHFDTDARSKYSAGPKGVNEIAEAALNNKQVKIYKRKDNPEDPSEVDPKATEEARIKTELLKEAFTGDPEKGVDGWVWGDDDRSQLLEGIYNRQFNNLAPRKFDGSHLTFPGLNPDFAERQHRKDVVWRIIQNGNTLMAHAVGSGKTVSMIAAGMEQKRLGLVNKPAYIVPNHMLEQFSREFIQAYPDAKILVANKDELSADNRKAFMGKVAANDWDGVIFTHGAFGRINMRRDFRESFIREQMDELSRVMDAEAEKNGKKSPTVKNLEKAKKRYETKLEKLLKEEGKDEGVNFEETGIDFLFVDEAHLFKNLDYLTKMERVKGLSQNPSQRAEDLFLKTRYLEQNRPGRSAVFATGTPVSNTIAEMWTMQRYLQNDKLKEAGLDTFDNWANTFGRVVTRSELKPDGRTFEDVSSFSKFVNIPELISLYSEIADTKTADMLNLPRPNVKTHTVKAKLSPQEEKFMEALVQAAQDLKGTPPEEGKPNMASLTVAGRKLAADGRLIGNTVTENFIRERNPDLKEEMDFNPNGKVAKAVDNIHRIWQKGNEDPSDPGKVQMVFLDLGTPQTKGRKKKGSSDESADSAQQEESRLNLYDDMKNRLIEKGIPANEIAFIHDAKNDEQKGRLFSRVRRGDVRVFFGSTEKMGVGTNVQDKLVAMHHLDAPWKPAEVEQRDGRIVRQGNKNKDVEIYRYATERSFDAFMWQTLERKAGFLNQMVSGSKGSRIAEDIDNPLPDAAQMKAAASGDPRILEHAELDRDVRQLQSQRRVFEQTKQRATWESNAAKARIEQYEKALPGAKEDASMVQDTKGDKFAVDLGGTAVKERKEVGKAILENLLAQTADRYSYRNTVYTAGKLSGFDMQVELQPTWDGDGKAFTATLSLRGKSGYASPNNVTINEHTDPVGLVRKFENILSTIKDNPARLESALAGERKSVDSLQKTMGGEWTKEKDYQEKLQKLKELTTALKAPKHPDVHEEEVHEAAERQPMARKVIKRDASGRPIKTEPVRSEASERLLQHLIKGWSDDGIVGYHGSPHKFTQFDSSKIGTGEGAQAYGYGLYFAENEAVGREYKNNLGGRLRGDEIPAAWALDSNHGDRLKAIADLREIAADPGHTLQEKSAAAAHGRAADLLERGWTKPTGFLYQVRINADREHFLDWDKPLSKQSPKVREALETIGQAHKNEFGNDPLSKAYYERRDPMGSDVIGSLEHWSGKRNYTQMLRDAGIPGIKYADQGSRMQLSAGEIELAKGHIETATWRTERAQKAGNAVWAAREQETLDYWRRELHKLEHPEEGTNNYVVFNDKDLTIRKRYASGGRVESDGKKITRDAFLYMEDPDNARFAQCGTCWLFRAGKKRCAILPDNFSVTAKDSCGYYLEGKPDPNAHIDHKTTPDKVGFVKATEVRCQNCKYGGSTCKLFAALNKAAPEKFDLDTNINPRGCCNAFTKASQERASGGAVHRVAGVDTPNFDETFGEFEKNKHKYFQSGSFSSRLDPNLSEPIEDRRDEPLYSDQYTKRAGGGRVLPHYINPNPTEAQKQAGNYRKAHINVHGLDIAIENAKGSERSGVGPDGKPWRSTLPAAYGYIKRTVGADSDHVDCYVGPHRASRKVFIVDQNKAENDKWDEHKCMLCFGSAAQARNVYLKGFSDGKGKDRLSHMTEMDIDQFKHWLRNGDTTKPLKGSQPKAFVKPVPIRPIRGSKNPKLPRSVAARTGDPLIDAILELPILKRVIDHPVVDDSHTIPNSFGGSEPIDNPTLYRDRAFPKVMSEGGVTFDTAEPSAIHENVEEFVIDVLTKAGMSPTAALNVAFWEFGEVAEDAFYRAHGMDPEKVEAKYTNWLNKIASRKATTVPPDLFRGTYPGRDPAKAGPGPIDKPTRDEVTRGRSIVRAYLEGVGALKGRQSA